MSPSCEMGVQSLPNRSRHGKQEQLQKLSRPGRYRGCRPRVIAAWPRVIAAWLRVIAAWLQAIAAAGNRAPAAGNRGPR
jgi:hypothetical protein